MDDLDKVKNELIANLWRAFPPLFTLIKSGWKKARGGGLSVYHYEILGLLLDRESITMSEACEQLGVGKTNLTPIIGTLIDRGLLRGRKADEDRRVFRVSLTPRGMAFMTRGREDAKMDLGWLFERLNGSELATLTRSLGRVQELLLKSNGKEA